MRTVKRVFCLVLALLLLAGPAIESTGAAGIVYFTAVNDQLLPLSDETMPLWSNGVLYVPASTLNGNDLGIYYSRSRDKMTALLYKQRSAITFDLETDTIYTNGGQTYTGSAIVRGDLVYLPLDVVCRYFSLDYSYTRISYGYLLRIKNENAVLSDAAFIDAAGASMSQRYTRYERAKAPAEEETPAPTESVRTPDPAQRTAYFVAEYTDAASAEQILAYLSSGRATFLFRPERLADAGGLLRRLAAGDGTTALFIDASAGAEDALTQIEAGNRALWAAANTKTRLVRLEGASEATARLVSEAGYCPMRFALDYGEGLASVSRMSSRILSAADRNRGSCCVFLGADAAAAASISALLTALRAENCTPARLTEVTVS